MIARLLGRPRMWAYRQIVAGRFGPVVHQRRHRWRYVDLARVEDAQGITFSADQLAAAGIWIPQPIEEAA
jgi:hypothetical protein